MDATWTRIDIRTVEITFNYKRGDTFDLKWIFTIVFNVKDVSYLKGFESPFLIMNVPEAQESNKVKTLPLLRKVTARKKDIFHRVDSTTHTSIQFLLLSKRLLFPNSFSERKKKSQLRQTLFFNSLSNHFVMNVEINWKFHRPLKRTPLKNVNNNLNFLITHSPSDGIFLYNSM